MWPGFNRVHYCQPPFIRASRPEDDCEFLPQEPCCALIGEANRRESQWLRRAGARLCFLQPGMIIE